MSEHEHSVRRFPTPADPVEQPPPRHMTVNWGAASLRILMILGVVAALRIAQALLVPLVIGFLISYALDPIVSSLVKRGSPRALAATTVFAVTLTAFGFTAYGLRNQAVQIIDRLPHAAQQLRFAIQARAARGPGPVTQVQRAADELRRLSEAPTPSKPAPAAVDHPPFQVADYLWASSFTVTSFIGDAIVILFLAFYLLLAGDIFRRRFIEIAGPTLSKKKITLSLLDAISSQVARYLFVRVLISVIVGVGTAAAFWMVGLTQPGVWGVVAGVFNVVPYLGPAAVAVAAGLAAFLQFQTLTLAAVTAGVAVGVAAIEAYVITPWLTSRTGDMNPVAVFIGLMFWGWLWGLPGLLLAMPLLMITKAICDHVEALLPVAALLRR